MSLVEILDEYHETECYKTVSVQWEESIGSLPKTGAWFLRKDKIVQFRRQANIVPDYDDVLTEVAGEIERSPGLTALIWHCFRSVYYYEDVSWETFRRWPDLGKALGKRGPVFYLIVALASVPLITAKHETLGVPADITRQTLVACQSMFERFRSGRPGDPGVFHREVGWLRNYTSGKLFRVGRFEYMILPFSDNLYAYRNRKTNNVLALSADGVRYSEQGFADIRPDEEESRMWTAHLSVDRRQVRGYPISPLGKAVHREVSIDRSDWREVIRPAETKVLDVHIPAGGRLEPREVQGSLLAALRFFASYHPDEDIAGFRCESWIFGPQLETLLGGDANLVRFMREVYLYPVPSDPLDGFFFIFADPLIDENGGDSDFIRSIVPRTRLQKIAREQFLDNKPWRGGGMFLLKEDLPMFGSAFYRSRWPPKGLGLDV